MTRLKTVVARNAWLRLVVLSLSTVCPAPALADGLSIVQVEEDWQLVVSTPETNSNSPQVTSAMSPIGGDTPAYMSFELNYRSLPDYEIGGLHLHAWDGDYLRGSVHTQPEVQLRTDHEVVTWTQSMTLVNGQLTYAVTNGNSTTWGTFGTGDLQLTVATNLTDFSSYNPEHSVLGSGIGFGSNRVSSLVLKRVRFITSNGEMYELEVNYNVLETRDE